MAKPWEVGRKGLERALAKGLNFAFESTLDARAVPQMLIEGARQGAHIHLWYAGLTSPQLHLQHVQNRVAAGGHDIPEAKIRERYETSRTNLIRLFPHLGLPSRTNTCRPWSEPSCGSTSARQRSMQVMATHGESASRCCVACSTSEVQPACLDQGDRETTPTVHLRDGCTCASCRWPAISGGACCGPPCPPARARADPAVLRGAAAEQGWSCRRHGPALRLRGASRGGLRPKSAGGSAALLSDRLAAQSSRRVRFLHRKRWGLEQARRLQVQHRDLVLVEQLPAPTQDARRRGAARAAGFQHLGLPN
jgi:hypothetical protein